MAAALGQSPTAVALLQEAFSNGVQYWINLHRYPFLDPLREYPPFQDFMRPKG